MIPAALKCLETLGSFCMWVLRIPEPVMVQTEEMKMAPSEGRSYINFDDYDPVQLQRNRSESDLTDEQ